MIRVYATGDYAHRQPLAYAPIRAACAPAIEVVDRFEAADLIVLAHFKDIEAHGAAIRARLAPHQRVVLLSEEPFWDTIWSPDPFAREQTYDTPEGPLAFAFLNHATSTIYDFAEIPYFLLTARSFFNRYFQRFARNARRTAEEWLDLWAACRCDIAFVAERRRDPKFEYDAPAHDVFGLATHRTAIALACTGPRVERAGAHWTKGVRRQDLPDWHLDKLVRYDGACRVMSGIENTHMATYVTEKFFDAFACGAVPAYIAGPGHRARGLVPGGSWINLYALDATSAADRLAAFTPDRAFAETYCGAQRKLAETFSDIKTLRVELRRVQSALTEELMATVAMVA